VSDPKVVAVFGEGPGELGHVRDRPLRPDELPALPQLIHRLLETNTAVTYTCSLFKDVKHVHGRGKKFAKKVVAVIRQAARMGHAAAVIVIDRDREADKERIEALREGRDSLNGPGHRACAVGVAVETFDAWMIADPAAIQQAGGDSGKSVAQPESLAGKPGSKDDPKMVAAEAFGLSKGVGLADKYAKAAAVADLETLAKKCPKGFRPFAEEVRERIRPAVG